MPTLPSRSLSSLRLSLSSKSSVRAPSPTFSEATTHASAINFGSKGPKKVITRADLKASLQVHEELINACSTYRTALISMSKATTDFADAMERCSTLKGPSYESGTRLQAAAGLHYLVGNLWHVLSESLESTFEEPLRQHLEDYQTQVQDRSQAYEQVLKEKSLIIHQTKRNMRTESQDTQTLRGTLTVLQRQLDELDELKAAHYEEILEHEEEVWDFVQGKTCIVLRSTMDVFDRFTAKASDPVIEPMLQSVPDPFDSYGPPQPENEIFSILTPLSMQPGSLFSTASVSASPSLGSITPSRDFTESKITSWLPGANGGTLARPQATLDNWATFPSTPPRSLSPTTTSSPSSSAATLSIRHYSIRERNGTSINGRSLLPVTKGPYQVNGADTKSTDDTVPYDAPLQPPSISGSANMTKAAAIINPAPGHMSPDNGVDDPKDANGTLEEPSGSYDTSSNLDEGQLTPTYSNTVLRPRSPALPEYQGEHPSRDEERDHGHIVT